MFYFTVVYVSDDFKPHSLNLKETATIDVESNGAVKVKIPRVEVIHIEQIYFKPIALR